MTTRVKSSVCNANLWKLPNEYGDVSVINKGIHVAFLKRSQVTCLSCICTGKGNFSRDTDSENDSDGGSDRNSETDSDREVEPGRVGNTDW